MRYENFPCENRLEKEVIPSTKTYLPSHLGSTYIKYKLYFGKNTES